MGKGALRPFFKGHSLKKEKEHEKKEVDKMLSHFVTLPFFETHIAIQRMGSYKPDDCQRGYYTGAVICTADAVSPARASLAGP